MMEINTRTERERGRDTPGVTDSALPTKLWVAVDANVFAIYPSGVVIKYSFVQFMEIHTETERRGFQHSFRNVFGIALLTTRYGAPRAIVCANYLQGVVIKCSFVALIQ